MLSVLHWKARESERKRMNHDLRTSAEDRSQRMLNALEPGTVVPVHRHVDTDETVICLEGRLEEIIYLADYIEPTRDFDGLDKLRELAYEDLDEAMMLALEMCLEEVRSRGVEPNEYSVGAYQWYCNKKEATE